MSRVGLLGGNPYQRDLVWTWLADARGVRSITPVIDGQRQPGRPPGIDDRSHADTDVIVAIVDDRDDPVLQTCHDLTDRGRSLPFVAVLVTPGPQVLQAALDAGADGVAAASSGQQQLATAVAAVVDGAAWLDPALSPIVMQQMVRPPLDDSFGLTPMQQRVAAYFPEGLTNREIGDRLGIGEETVKSHASNVFRKLGVSDRASATKRLQN